MSNELKRLHRIEAKAWKAMNDGSEQDASSTCGQHGKNYIAWCAAADACYEYRKAHGLLEEGR